MSAPDQAIRDRALDIRHSFAVSAPAGSGKTGLLVRRILRLLAVCDAPEQVLAITFTRKAAAEMQERIVEALTAARTAEPPGDTYQRAIWEDARAVLARDREKGWHLVSSPSRLRLMTIDGLCRHIARQLAIETELGDLPEPSEQPEEHYREAIRQLFAFLDHPGEIGDALALLLTHLDNNLATLENLLESLLARREQWLAPLFASVDQREHLEQSLKNTVSDTLESVRRALLGVEGELVMLADYAAANLTAAHSESPVTALAGISALPGTEACEDNLQRWQALLELLLKKDDDWRKSITKTQGFPAKKDSIDPDNAAERKARLVEVIDHLQEQPGLHQLLLDLRNLPGAAYSDNQWQLLAALTRVLPVLVAQLSMLFKSRHSSDFTEITLAAQRALGGEEDTTDVGLKLDYQIRHILIDEFQDTSSIQFDLLKRLTRGWQADDGRTLFVVGDGMQSLYGFRNANVGIFLEARRLPIGEIQLQPLDLQVNFRSDNTVVDWVNRCFRDIFPDREDISRGAVAYADAIAANSGATDSCVSVDIFDPDADEQREAEQVLALIAAARAADPGGSIAVLVRARSHLRAIIPALLDAGIDWEATDIDPLASRMPVQDLHSLTRALLNPADRIAWLALLRAPWCGLTLPDLHALACAGSVADGSPDLLPWLGGQVFYGDRAALGDDGRQRLARVSSVLQDAWRQRLRRPLRQWVEGTWLALGGPATLLNQQELTWCQQYLDLLEQHDSGGSVEDMARFETALGNLYAAPTGGAGNPVQIMTIHKSKGLEFDTVILPGLHKGGAPSSSELLYWRERINGAGDPELLISPLLTPGEDNGAAEGRLVAHLKYEAKVKSGLEDARVLYVACTRAIKRLHLLFRQPAKTPSAGSLLACLNPALETSAAAGAAHRYHETAVTTDDGGDGNGALRHISRLTANWQHLYLSGAQTTSAAPERQEQRQGSLFEDPVADSSDSGGDATGDADDRETGEVARQLGVVLHRTLCHIGRNGVEGWDRRRVNRQRQPWQLQLRQLGIEAPEQATDTLVQALTTMLEDATGRWLLDPTHRDSACELAIADGHGDGVAVIDRTFIVDGVRWIVDYKSSTPHVGEPLDAFLARETSLYRDQLLRYRTLFVRSEPAREIRIALYFPLIAQLALIDQPS